MHSFLKLAIIFSLGLIIDCKSTDPDLLLCEELTIGAAVFADDGKDNVFEGYYYWEIDLNSGISTNFGEPIKERWIDLPTPIDATFSVDERQVRKSVVFIKV
jgi:hypothetical protein